MKAFDITIDKDRILEICGCKKDNPLYEDTAKQFHKIYKEFEELKSPKYWVEIETEELNDYRFIHYPETKAVVFCALTIGQSANEKVKEKFSQGNYMEGILLDALCSEYLFRYSEAVKQEIKEKLAPLKIWEELSPLDNIDPSYQQLILEKLTDEIKANDAGILDPIKSMTFIITAGEGAQEGCHIHNCKTCNKNHKCSYRKEYKIHVLNDHKDLFCFKGEKLYQVLTKAGYSIPAPCGAHGHCGQCKVIVNGKPELSCTYKIEKDIEVSVNEFAKSYEIPAEKQTEARAYLKKSPIYIAGDIGTTTCEISFFDDRKQLILSHKFNNPQRSYGTDVISRIKNGADGHLEEMTMLIREKITFIIENFISGYKLKPDCIKKAVFSMNTVMSYLFLEENPEKLGTYPFTADLNLNRVFSGKELFNLKSDFDVFIVPFISAFVGGDIVSGISLLEKRGYDNYLLADLGTNGELVLKQDGRIFTTSAAAGPAFEGGNITFGMGSISGAVYDVVCNPGFAVKTIDNAPPCGICGSGLISAVSSFISYSYIDQTGLIQEKYFNTGIHITEDIYITQQDIRQFQMAKSAIRSGIEILLKEAGSNYNAVDKVFLSGGFGSNVDIQAVICTGILPEAFTGKVFTAGNTSLSGALEILFNNEEPFQFSKENITEINLSEDERFNDLYIQYMDFC